jgi:hypothetical protein
MISLMGFIDPSFEQAAASGLNRKLPQRERRCVCAARYACGDTLSYGRMRQHRCRRHLRFRGEAAKAVGPLNGNASREALDPPAEASIDVG